MSISQIKKQFEELSAYLGRDVRGLEKLRRLKEPVNELRTKLAASDQAALNSTANMELAVAESLKAKSELVDAKLEIHSLSQQVANLTRALADATKTEAVKDDENNDGNVLQRQYRGVIKELRKHLSECPHPTANAGTRKHFRFDRSSFSKGWSHQSLWILGASVAVLSALDGEVSIISEQRTPDLESFDEDGPKVKHQTIQWAKKLIDLTETDPLSSLHKQKMHAEAVNSRLSQGG